jgi:predicted alpha/beta-fold hydrolase
MFKKSYPFKIKKRYYFLLIFVFPFLILSNLIIGFYLAFNSQYKIKKERKKRKIFDSYFSELKFYFNSIPDFYKNFNKIEKEDFYNFFVKENIIFINENLKINFIQLQTNKNENEKWIILIHGWKENKYCILSKNWFWLKNNFNIISFDLRGHGKNYDELSQLGKKEESELGAILNYLQKKFGNQIQIGVIGENIGGSTIIEYLKKHHKSHKIKFAIVENTFDTLENQYKWIIWKKFKLNYIFGIFGTKFFNKFLYNLKIKENKPIENLDLIKKTPICFFYHTNNNLISKELINNIFKEKIKYENKGSIKSKLMIIDHNNLDKENYWNEKIKFANKFI